MKTTSVVALNVQHGVNIGWWIFHFVNYACGPIGNFTPIDSASYQSGDCEAEVD
ncbi:hypothetical protein C8J46_106113 [Sphingomonas sp. PP-F2F-A104-K0414]|nr:hypothetical protein C8J46_106113 [Sphingomonas sp. PP-F2F-A104-K0414]